LPLLEGTYLLTVAVHNWEDTQMFDYHDRTHVFQVLPDESGERYGLVTFDGEWEHGGVRGSAI
jgi:hypothetical protein